MRFARFAVVPAVLCCFVVAPAGAHGQQQASTGGAAPATASKAAVRTLKPGMHGRRVRALQRRVHIRADGVYGRATKRAVKRFQRRHRLTVDGVAGPATLRALGLVPHAAVNSTVASSNPPADVRLPRRIPARDMRVLDRIAKCESGGNPAAVSANGTYRGKYQFHVDTWAAVGGSGDPAEASETEQDKRAWVLYHRSGSAPWGACA